MWFTHCLRGSGMSMMTGFMPTLSPLTPTACGGIGVGIIRMAAVGDSAGDGVRRGITIAGIIPVIGVATGVATGALIMDGITTTIIIIRTIPVTDGVAATGVAVTDGMDRTDVARAYMPEDIPITMVSPARVGTTA